MNRADLETQFIAESRRYLRGEYLPKITACVERLSDADIWWRPNEESNSIGNLMLHLAGNVRQWIIAGIGEVPDTRKRQAEFDERREIPKDRLMEELDRTLREADAVLAALPPEALAENRTIQGRTTTIFDAIYHVVEHFSMHVGQIAYLTKARTGKGLGFYRNDDAGLATPTLSGELPDD